MNSKSVMKNITGMIILNITILIAVLTIHELGHVVGGKIIGCNNAKAIIFDSEKEGPYTELLCEKTENQNIAYLSSLMFTGLFGLSFLAFDNKTQRSMIFVALGFGLLLAGLDIVVITGFEIMKYLFIVSGFAIILFGEVLLGISYANQN